ncbi:GTPase Era [Candidatus Uhrbacteria bacterium]|nr:GTPase Era [Candidatus Uhrbacteria bacterium]
MSKSGFVVMIGRSNVGKSTLMNSIVGSKIAITTPKPQTTRLPIQGIITRDEGQIVFVDTPGILKGAKDLLSKRLAEAVRASLEDVDIIAYIVDPTREIGQEEREVMRMIEEIDKPKVLVINKVDLEHKPFIDFYRDLSENYTATVEVSALRGTNVHRLVETFYEYLPEGIYYYPEHQLTNMPNKIWLAELIREKLFLRLRQELPYTTHVEVTEVEERANGMMYVAATIFTTEDRYKRMIIGQGGRGVREIGQSTRKELEAVMGSKVFLDLNVEVNTHWMERFE